MAKRNPTKYFKDIKDAVILIVHFRHVRSHVALLPMVGLFAKDLASSKRHLTNKIKDSLLMKRLMLYPCQIPVVKVSVYQRTDSMSFLISQLLRDHL